jgi:hypothetical protein
MHSTAQSASCCAGFVHACCVEWRSMLLHLPSCQASGTPHVVHAAELIQTAALCACLRAVLACLL